MMFLTFYNHKKNLEGNTQENNTLSPYKSSPTWVIESFFIEIYSLLAHRVKGLGWSLKEFWQCDTWTTSKLYCMELDLIDEEEKELKKSKKDPTVNNNEEVEEVYSQMFGEDSE